MDKINKIIRNWLFEAGRIDNSDKGYEETPIKSIGVSLNSPIQAEIQRLHENDVRLIWRDLREEIKGKQNFISQLVITTTGGSLAIYALALAEKTSYSFLDAFFVLLPIAVVTVAYYWILDRVAGTQRINLFILSHIEPRTGIYWETFVASARLNNVENQDNSSQNMSTKISYYLILSLNLVVIIILLLLALAIIPNLPILLRIILASEFFLALCFLLWKIARKFIVRDYQRSSSTKPMIEDSKSFLYADNIVLKAISIIIGGLFCILSYKALVSFFGSKLSNIDIMLSEEFYFEIVSMLFGIICSFILFHLIHPDKDNRSRPGHLKVYYFFYIGFYPFSLILSLALVLVVKTSGSGDSMLLQRIFIGLTIFVFIWCWHVIASNIFIVGQYKKINENDKKLKEACITNTMEEKFADRIMEIRKARHDILLASEIHSLRKELVDLSNRLGFENGQELKKIDDVLKVYKKQLEKLKDDMDVKKQEQSIANGGEQIDAQDSKKSAINSNTK